MELVINIDEETFKELTKYDKPVPSGNRLYDSILESVFNGTPLPEHHGRLIDVNSVHQIVRPSEPSDAEWGMTAETAKQLIHDAFNKAPTILEGSESK